MQLVIPFLEQKLFSKKQNDGQVENSAFSDACSFVFFSRPPVLNHILEHCRVNTKLFVCRSILRLLTYTCDHTNQRQIWPRQRCCSTLVYLEQPPYPAPTQFNNVLSYIGFPSQFYTFQWPSTPKFPIPDFTNDASVVST